MRLKFCLCGVFNLSLALVLAMKIMKIKLKALEAFDWQRNGFALGIK
jgi:hypothetical protein